MSGVRPLSPDDLPAVAEIYGDFIGWDSPDRSGFADFFGGAWFHGPLARPEVVPLGFEDDEDGIVGFVGSNLRPYRFGDRELLIACSGPIVVRPEHHRRGIARALKQTYGEGPQVMTANDRGEDRVHDAWVRLGSVNDTAASIGWIWVLAPAAFAVNVASRRLRGGKRVASGPLLRRVDAAASRRLRIAPSDGEIEPLTPASMVDLLERLRGDFALLPAYDVESLTWLFGVLGEVDPALGPIVLRLVRDASGRPVGAYAMFVRPSGPAQVLQVAAAPADAGFVLDHLAQDAASQGALEVRGRVEPHLFTHLRRRKVLLAPDHYWAIMQTDDVAVSQAVLSGQALMTRLEGEWWLRPWPSG